MKYRTPRSIRNRRRQRRNVEFRCTRKRNWQSQSQWRRRRYRRSLLDLIVMPPLLFIEECVERLRDLLHVG